jgi:hypothetical protein
LYIGYYNNYFDIIVIKDERDFLTFKKLMSLCGLESKQHDACGEHCLFTIAASFKL